MIDKTNPKLNNLRISVLVILMAGLFSGVCFAAETIPQNTAKYSVSTSTTRPAILNKGEGFSVRGTISSDKKIVKILIGVTDGNGTWIRGLNTTVEPQSKSFNLSQVDSKLKFGKLSVGSYYYKISCYDSKGQREVLNQPFKVVTATSTTIRFIEEAGKPVDMYVGNGFPVTGTLASNKTMAKIIVGVTDTEGKFILGVKATKTGKYRTYNLKNLDSSVRFGLLQPGEYYYKVLVYTPSGTQLKRKTVLSTRFNIKPLPTGIEAANELISYAAQFEGNPYVLGGNSLETGTDCSGFIKLIYQNFGYTLPRTSTSISKVGEEVPEEELLPGDILYYTNTFGTVYHVSLYMGDAKVIHASSPTRGIVIDPLTYKEPQGIRRILKYDK